MSDPSNPPTATPASGDQPVTGHGASGFATRAIHAGQEPDPRTGAVNVPIYASSTFAQDGVGQMRAGYEYARTANPSRTALEQCLASLEGGRFGRAFSSGMAATDAALRSLLRPGDHVIIPDDAYGGTFRLIDKIFTLWGISYTPVNVADPAAVQSAITTNTKALWVESPTNPLLNIADLAVLSQISRSARLTFVVDNTFATAYLQQPLALGADVVLHSTTKYLGGHSDVVGGALLTNDAELDAAFGFLQNGAGAVPGAFDTFLTLRGIKTLAVRMEQHCTNAEAIVEMLQNDRRVAQVLYPGLSEHPGHEVAKRQMNRFGAMISIRLAGGREAAMQLCKNTEIFTLAESLGGVESLIEHPGAMTHASTAGSVLEVPDDLVRLSVGIEDVDDLIGDLNRSLV